MVRKISGSAQPQLLKSLHAFGLAVVAASACYGQHAGYGPVSGASGVGHSAAGRAMPGGMRRAAPAGIGIRGNRGTHVNAVGSTTNPTAPMPTWELPRNITPQWEIPHTANTVLPNDVQGNRVPHPRGDAFGVAVPYIIDPYAFGNEMYADQAYADDTAGQQQAPPANAGSAQYDPSLGGPEAPPQGPSQRPAYVPQETAVTSNPGPITNGLDHPEVTLVFKDGRAPMKVQSYAVTGAAVYVAENGHQRQIPLSALDLPATVKTNEAAGVDFELPR
jgi:hypothetical protein